MLVAHRPSSRARAACAAVTSAGSSPPPSSAVTSKPISSSANAAARFCRSRSASLSPYMESPSASFVVVATTTTFFCRRCHNHDKRRHPVGARRGCSQGRAAGFLTECSVYASIVVVPMASPGLPNAADAVVVGGGTVGAWCAYFLRTAGLERVVLIEKGVLGQGASSRAAGVVRLQGGTPEAVRLGIWSRRFYLGQRDEIGTDSGFTEQGFLLPCFTEADVAAARERMAMQTELGVPVRWLDPGEVDAANPTLAPGQTLGGTFCDQDGFIAPPRNVAAYTVALIRSGGEVREHVAFRGLAGRH